MAVELLELAPNVGLRIQDGDVRNVVPQELRFKFTLSEIVDASTLPGNIRVVRAGFDDLLGNANDIVVTPGFLGAGEAPNEVVLRFADSLPDDKYEVTVDGSLRFLSGQFFHGGVDQSIRFDLELGAQVVAVVPQPIDRAGANLSQRRDQIDVYFNDDNLDPADATNPAFYQLILTNDTASNLDDVVFNPTGVTYSASADRATLTFARDLHQLVNPRTGQPIGTATWRLRVGTNQSLPAAPSTVLSEISAVSDLGTAGAARLRFSADPRLGERFRTSPRVVFTASNHGGSGLPFVALDGNNVLIDLNTNVADPSTAGDVVNALAAAGFHITASLLPGGNPDAIVTGAAGMRLVLTGLGSSFTTATDLGTLTTVGPMGSVRIDSRTISAAIDPQVNLLDFPGTEDEPGHRNVPADVGAGFERHVNPDFGPDSDLGVTTIRYNFKSEIGVSPLGDRLFNFITEDQKNRVREALSLWSERLGAQFLETVDSGLTFATGDPRAIDAKSPNANPSPGQNFIVRVDPRFENGMLVLDSSRAWKSRFGEDYFDTAMVGVGFLLGLERASDLPEPTTMAFAGAQSFPGAPPPEPIAPGNADVLHGQIRYRPDSNDLDLYRFTVDLNDAASPDKKTATLVLETFAERQPNSSLLNTLLTVYREVPILDAGGNVIGVDRRVVARNDDYFSKDSYVELHVQSGTYFVQVTSTGNISIDPNNEGSGFGGTTQGPYQLRLDLRPSVDGGNVIRDLDRADEGLPGTALDGDGNGEPGGAYNFWFRAATPADSIYVDKAHTPNFALQVGTISNPFNRIDQALEIAQPGKLVRIVGNAGADGNPATLADNLGYEVGLDLGGAPLEDGRTMELPQGVTVMIDAGAIMKMRQARIGVGSSTLTVDRSGSSLQVLGTPAQSVYFTSWLDEVVGRDRYVPVTAPSRGDWGGLRFQADLDRAEARFIHEDEAIFLNYVNHADMRYGGGRLTVDSVEQVVRPVHMVESRPTVTFNRVTFSADAAFSADPDSFRETNFHSPEFQLFETFTSDYQRIGPEIHGNILLNNSTNGLFVSIATPAGNTSEKLTVPARFDDTDVVHVMAENLVIQGTAGAPILELARPPIGLLALTALTGGSLPSGTYNYKVVFFDINGFEGRPSEATTSVTLTGARHAVRVSNLPPVTGNYVGRRVYRSTVGGVGPYSLVAELDVSDTTFVDNGSVTGPKLQRDPPSVLGVTLAAQPGGLLGAGRYNYRVVFVDSNGNDGPSSDATSSISLAGGQSIRLASLPSAAAPFVARRVYRSNTNGQTPYQLVATLNATATTFLDDGSAAGEELPLTSLGVVQARTDGRLRVDPGIVLKMEGARIEATFGSQFIAEGTEERPVILTSRFDDRYGAGGTFDTPSDGATQLPGRGDWGGIYLGQTAKASIDHATISFGGGDTRVEGTFLHFGALEVHQAELRLANSLVEENADGVEAIGIPIPDRQGRLPNDPATIFVRGAQPVLLNNVIRNNEAQAITIDVNSLIGDLKNDSGRTTGEIAFGGSFLANRGPLVHGNILEGNPLNGMNVRGGVLTTEAVFDDTDITHVLYEEVIVPNFHTFGGLRLQSSANEGLVVKLGGAGDSFAPHLNCDSALDNSITNIDGPASTYANAYLLEAAQSVQRRVQADGAVICDVTSATPLRTGMTQFVPTSGLTASGSPADIDDRIGGTVQILGRPLFPVILTSLSDDSVGSGFKRNGQIQKDTNNDGLATVARPADWRSVRLEQYANDRNVAIVLETGSSKATPENAQFVGELAPSEHAGGDDLLRLGVEVHGVLDSASEVDVYSFKATAGTEVWLDIDRTTFTLNTVLELVTSQGDVIARSDDSLAESLDKSLLVHSAAVPDSAVNPLQRLADAFQAHHVSGLAKDFYSLNQFDAGMRLVLPGVAGTRSTYHIRVRSWSSNLDNLAGGETSGAYQLQLRLRETDEAPGVTVRNAEIRYAMNGIEIVGLPGNSPLVGEAGEDEVSTTVAENNGVIRPDQGINVSVPGRGPQDLGSLLQTNRAAISVAGSLSVAEDVDFFQFRVSYNNDGSGNPSYDYVSTTFDVDYAHALGRPNTNMAVFDEFGRLILFAQDSNIADDRPAPLDNGNLNDLATGSVGPLDPFIGPVELPEGIYFVAISSSAYLPEQLVRNPMVRREPINSIQRVVEDHVGSFETSVATPPQIATFFQESNIQPLAPDRVTAFILQDAQGPLDRSDLRAVDPFSGATRWERLTYIGNAEDITTRIDGGVYGLSTPDAAPAPNDQFTGLLQGVNVSRPQFVGSRSDNIRTYHEDPNIPGLAVLSDVGIRFQASAIGFIDGQEVLLAVGVRGDINKVPRPRGPASFSNLLYRLDPRTGEAISAPQTPRVGGALLAGGGTDVVERGILDTLTSGGPGGQINGITILDNTVYVLTDTGGLFRVNDPLGLSGPATLTYIKDVVPPGHSSTQFGVITEREPNNLPTVAGAQNLDKEIWTLRNDPNILNSTSFKHITVRGRGDGSFDKILIDNNIATLDGPEGITVGPDGTGDGIPDLYVASRNTGEVLRFDGVTGDFVDTYIAARNATDQVIEMEISPLNGDIFVSVFNTNGGEILRYSGVTGLFDSVFASVTSPLGMTFDNSGNLYVASRLSVGTGQLVRLTPGGVATPLIVFLTSAPLNVVLNPAQDTLFVAESTNVVSRWTLAGASAGANAAPTGFLSLTTNPQHLPGMFVDGAGMLTISSPAENRVRQFAGGAHLGILVDQTVGGLTAPTGIAVGPTGGLLVSSFDDDKLLLYSSTGQFQGSRVPARAGGVDEPSDVVVGPDGALYVASRADSDAILRFDRATGAFLNAFVTDSSGGLNNPFSMVFRNGSLFVSSQQTNQVLKYNGTTGAFQSVFAAGVNQARGLTFGPDGNLYVASASANAVLRYNGTTGAFLGFFVPGGRGGLNNPGAVAFGPDGNLYVASEGSNQVLRYGSNGTFIDVFATGLSAPRDLEFGPDGNLYIANAGNSTVVRYNAATGALVDQFLSGGADGLTQLNGITISGGKLYASSGADVHAQNVVTDRVLQYDITGAQNFDYYTFTVEEANTQVVIDIDFTHDGTPSGTNAVLFLTGAATRVSDDESPTFGAGGSVSRRDPIIGGDPANPLILAKGVYTIAVAEFDPTAPAPATAPTNPLDLTDTYTLHISMSKRDDTAVDVVSVRDFEGLTTAIRQVPGDPFEKTLLAVDTLGKMFSFDTTGNPKPFFSGPNPYELPTGADHARGIALSTTYLHVNDTRADDFGHGLSGVFDDSRGRSPISFAEVEPNETFGNPQELEQLRWSLGYDSNIGDDFNRTPLTINTSTFLPHVTVHGTGSGSNLDGTASRDFYSFQVTKPDSYVQLEIDFSFAAQLIANRGQPGNDPVGPALPYGRGLIDAQLILYDSHGDIVTLNDNVAKLEFGDGGCSIDAACNGLNKTSNTFDPDNPARTHEPYFDIVLQPGTYTVEVTKFDPETLQFFLPPEDGDEYTLQVSVEGHSVDLGGEKDNGGSSFFWGSNLTGVITDATAANPVLITSAQHGLLSGQFVYVEGVRGIRLANGTYRVTASGPDQFTLVAADGTDLPFSPDGPYQGGGTWRLIQMPENMRGEITSVPFSLENYRAADKPVFYFNYMMNLETAVTADFFRVSISENGGPRQTLLVKADLDNVQGECGATNPFSPCPRDTWHQARVPLDAFAGKGNLQITLEFDTLDNLPSNVEGVFVDDFIIGFAERGEMISNAYNDPLFELDPDAPANEVAVGAYQLEIRRSSEFGVSQQIGDRGRNPNALELTRSFDTNDRLAQKLTLVADSGGALLDGQTFTIGDGNRSVTFEYDLGNGVAAGHAPVFFQPMDSAVAVAAAIQAAINSNSTQSVIPVQASAYGERVDLFGNAIVDPFEITVLVQGGSGDENRFRDQGQVLIESNLITDARDFGIAVSGGGRETLLDAPLGLGNPNAGTPRNLPNIDVDPAIALTAGVTIANNVIATEGLGGIHYAGDVGVWELVPVRPVPYPVQTAGGTSGQQICDGDAFIVTALGITQRFEFEDISGSGRPCGNGVDGGNGWTEGSVPIFYRRDDGYLILRGIGYSQTEMVYALREAINSSILVTNGTSLHVTATPYFSRALGSQLLGSDPALFLEHVSNIQVVRGAPFQVIRQMPLRETALPFGRIVNNTVYGHDGLESTILISGRTEPNDTFQTAIQTHQGRANLPEVYQSDAAIGDRPGADADFYQFQMGIGDRVTVDVDGGLPSLDTTLRLFNARGQELAFADNRPAPGETTSLDPYVDFTATESGVYYVIVEGRTPTTRGDYTITVDVMAPHQWVLQAVDGSRITDGTTFTVSDRNRVVVFEMDAAGSPAVTPGRIAVGYNPSAVGANARGPGYLAPEIAVVIADAINAVFGSTVHATALGGFQGQTAGGPGNTLPTAIDFNDRNFGHDYDPTRIFVGQISTFGPFATAERYVAIDGAVIVKLGVNSPFSLRPTGGAGGNADQLIPERGIFLSERASVTMLNNVLANLNQGVFQEDSDTSIMGGSLFQNNLFNHNIAAVNESFTLLVPGTAPLFVNSEDRNFYPAPGSRAIDSSIDSLQDRSEFVALKATLGLSPSPILVPERDLFGQLRVDDPNQDSPPGLGENVFKDRGAVERADFVGPLAVLRDPLDNDGNGVDLDPADTIVHIDTTLPVTEFRLALVDRGGIGIDDAIIDSTQFILTETTRNGRRRLVDGRDYFFIYGSTSDEVTLRAVTEFANDARFELTVNNAIVRDRAGNLLQSNRNDGSTAFTIIITDTVNAPPVNAVPGAQVTNEDTPVLLVGPLAISVSDPDAFLGTNEVQVTLLGDHGSTTLGATTGLTFLVGDGTDDGLMTFQGDIASVNAALAGLSFRPAQDYFGSASLTVTTSDLGNFSGSGIPATDVDVINFTVLSVNDAPVNRIPSVQSMVEDTFLVFSSANGNAITVTDVDAAAGTDEMTVELTGPGALTLATTTGLTFQAGANGTGTFRVRGLRSALNAALNGLRFVPAADLAGNVSISIVSDDLGNFGSGGPKSDSDLITIAISPVNDAPRNVVPGARTIDEDVPLVFSAADVIRIDDVDAGTGTIEVRLTATNGTVSLNGTTGLSIVGGANNSADVTFRGQIGAVNAALDGMSFTGTRDFFGTAGLTVRSSDLGNTGVGGALSDVDSIDITINSVNDAPVNSAPAGATTDEDTSRVFSAANGNRISVADVDSALSTGRLEITLSALNGVVTIGGTTGLSFSAGDGSADATMTFRGLIADINTALATVTVLPNADFNDARGTTSLTISSNDLGGTGSGGPKTTTTTIPIAVRAIDDAPVNTVPPSQATAEDTALIFSTANGNAVRVADLDAFEGTGQIQLRLQASNGTVTLATVAGLTFTAGDGVADPTMTFSGTPAELNTALNGMSFLPNLDFNNNRGSASLLVATDDLGNFGAGGPLTDSDTIAISVTAVDDPPTNVVPGVQTTNEDTPLLFAASQGNALSIVDVDASEGTGTSTVVVTLAATSGRVTLGSTSGLSFSAGTGTSDVTMTFQASLANANAAIASVTFVPNPNFNDLLGASSLRIETAPLGGASDVDTIPIQVTPVNDAPVHSVPGSQSTAEDTGITFSAANGNRVQTSDVDVAQGDGRVEVTLTATAGTLTLASTAGVTLTVGDGTADPVIRFSGPIAAVNSVLGNFTFLPNPDFNNRQGSASVQVVTSDLGNTGLGGLQTDSDTIAIDVTPVNDAPVNTVPGPLTMNEDATLLFSAAAGTRLNVSDADLAEGNRRIEITLTSEHGVATLGTLAGLTFNQGDGNSDALMRFSGLITDVSAALANVTFVPDADFNNNLGTARVTMASNDLGNFGAGGAKSDTDSVTISVLPINDAPVNQLPASASTNEDVPLVFSTANGNRIQIRDVDAPEGTTGIQVSLTGTQGTLTLSTVSGLSFVVGDGTADATMTFTGSLAQVNAALDGMQFIPAMDFNDGAGSASLAIQTNDRGNFGAPGALSDSDTLAIQVVAVNDAPVNRLPAPPTMNEDSSIVLANANAISVSDVDVANGTGILEVRLTAPGVLTLAQTAGLTFSDGDGTADATMTFRGTPANINAALNGLLFAPSAHLVGVAGIEIVTSDLGNFGTGGIRSTTSTLDVNITAINDAPRNVVPGLQTVVEDQSLAFSTATGNAIRAADVDVLEGTGRVSVRFDVQDGTVTLGSLTGLTFVTGDGTDDPTMQFTGLLGAVNLALDTLTFRPSPNFAGPAVVTFTVDDLGNNGTGGPLSDSDAITVIVTAVNDAPINVVPGPQTTDEDTALELSATRGNAINILDVDAFQGTGKLRVTLLAENGSLTLGNRTALQFSLGDGVEDREMTFEGGLSSISASLASVTFLPLPNFFGVGTVTIIANDLGNFGAGGSLTDTDTFQITVNSVNDPPVTLGDAAKTLVNTPVTISVLSNDQDVDGQLVASTVTPTAPTHGSVAVLANGSIRYTPETGYFGLDSFTYTVRDNQGATSNVATVNLVVNSPPVARDDVGTGRQFASTNINVVQNDTDAENKLLPFSVTFVTQPQHGTVSVDNSGVVTYTPTGNYFGPDSFTYTVADDDGAVSNVATVRVTVQEFFPWQNPRNRFDVNNDGFVSAIDVLLISDYLSRRGSGPLPNPPAPPNAPPPFVDVSGDNQVSALDAALVSDFLSTRANGGGEGESALVTTVVTELNAGLTPESIAALRLALGPRRDDASLAGGNSGRSIFFEPVPAGSTTERAASDRGVLSAAALAYDPLADTLARIGGDVRRARGEEPAGSDLDFDDFWQTYGATDTE